MITCIALFRYVHKYAQVSLQDEVEGLGKYKIADNYPNSLVAVHNRDY